MDTINTDDFFYREVSGDDEQAYIFRFMNSLSGLAENAIRFLRKNKVEIPSARFDELWAIDDENVIDSFNCRMGQPTRHSDPVLTTKEANSINHDDFPLVAAAKVIKWTREAQLVFKDIERISTDAVGAKSAIIELAYHVALIDRVTNAIGFSDVLASAKASQSARHPRRRLLHQVVEEIWFKLFEDRRGGERFPALADVLFELDRREDIEVNTGGDTVKLKDSKPIAFRTIRDWMAECKNKCG